MKKVISILLLVPLLLVNAVPTHRKAAQHALASSVLIHSKIVVKNAKGQTEKHFIGCSGTYVSPFLILTAAHCFNGVEATTWARGPYESVGYPVHLVYWDKKADLALLDAPFGHPYVKIGSVPKWGDKVINIGSPYDFEFVQSEGTVGPVAYYASGFNSSYLVTTAMANPGSSGGGAFNVAGELVGVNTMVIGAFGWSGITMAVNTNSIRQFMTRALKYYHHYGIKDFND